MVRRGTPDRPAAAVPRRRSMSTEGLPGRARGQRPMPTTSPAALRTVCRDDTMVDAVRRVSVARSYPSAGLHRYRRTRAPASNDRAECGDAQVLGVVNSGTSDRHVHRSAGRSRRLAGWCPPLRRRDAWRVRGDGAALDHHPRNTGGLKRPRRRGGPRRQTRCATPAASQRAPRHRPAGRCVRRICRCGRRPVPVRSVIVDVAVASSV